MEPHSFRSLQKKRTTNFREDETKLLIQLWGSPQIQNKLYLTHRKEPVMRILAANMQHRGFYRTPDEIKTRIRNLKCLYHRIKRSLQSGAGIGTVDPDWPHYKTMDAILSKQSQKKDIYNVNVLEGPRCEDIKQEIIDEIDINDDMESFTSNSLADSEYEEDKSNTLPPLTPAPRTNEQNKNENNKKSTTTSINNTVLPNNFSIQQSNQNVRGTIPFPLLILNGLQTNQVNQTNNDVLKSSKLITQQHTNDNINTDLLKELLEVQKENLNIEKQRLELEKQRSEFERFVGSQLLAFAPVIGTVLQKLVSLTSDNNETNSDTTSDNNNKKKNGKKRTYGDDDDCLKDSKILRTLLDENLKELIQSQRNISKKEDNDIQKIDDDEESNSSNK